jgi:hypothetical protein
MLVIRAVQYNEWVGEMQLRHAIFVETDTHTAIPAG